MKPHINGILLVEDDPLQVRLMREALRENGVITSVNVVGSGAAAIDHLQRAGTFGNASVPDMVILDLNMPTLNGLDVLERIKNHEDWKVIPVVILSTSDAEEDIARSYALHANCYIVKPLEFGSFMDMIQRIEAFWLNTVRLPGSITQYELQ